MKDLSLILYKNGDKLLLSHWVIYKAGLIPLQHLVNAPNHVVVKNNYGEYQNWHIISPKGNPILREVIKQTITNK